MSWGKGGRVYAAPAKWAREEGDALREPLPGAVWLRACVATDLPDIVHMALGDGRGPCWLVSRGKTRQLGYVPATEAGGAETLRQAARAWQAAGGRGEGSDRFARETGNAEHYEGVFGRSWEADKDQPLPVRRTGDAAADAPVLIFLGGDALVAGPRHKAGRAQTPAAHGGRDER